MLSGSKEQAEWFSFEITAEEAPWLYYRGAEVQRMSTAAEMLASYAALHAFGYLDGQMDHGKEETLSLLAVGTDNLANEQLARRRLTTKLPLGLLMLQVQTKLWDNGLWLDARWRPRDENTEADLQRFFYGEKGEDRLLFFGPKAGAPASVRDHGF